MNVFIALKGTHFVIFIYIVRNTVRIKSKLLTVKRFFSKRKEVPNKEKTGKDENMER